VSGVIKERAKERREGEGARAREIERWSTAYPPVELRYLLQADQPHAIPRSDTLHGCRIVSA